VSNAPLPSARDKLRPYQVEGVEFLVARNSAILADDPGLGKSAELLVAADEKGFQRILIVCPAIGRVSWVQQVRLWQRVPRVVLVADSHDQVPEGPCVVVVSYDQLNQKPYTQIFKSILDSRFDLLIADEFHYLKTPTAQRTKAIFGKSLDRKTGISSRVDTAWFASGTPAPNHTGELFPVVHAHFPGVWGRVSTSQPLTQAVWEETFCDVDDSGKYGRRITGSKNIPTLRRALEGIILRRKKSDVLTDLPPVQITDEWLDPDVLHSARMYLKADAQFSKMLPDGADSMTDEEFIACMLEYERAWATVRRNLGLLKAPTCVEWAKGILDNGRGKLILFAQHHGVIDILKDGLQAYGAVSIDGRTKFADRRTAEDTFQNGKARVFIGQLQAASTSLTLTAASDVALVECSPRADENAQAIARAHRFGQHNAVLARFLAVPGTLDEKIMRIFRRKAADMRQLFD